MRLHVKWKPFRKRKTLPLDTKYELVKAIDKETKPKSEKSLLEHFGINVQECDQGIIVRLKKKVFLL